MSEEPPEVNETTESPIDDETSKKECVLCERIAAIVGCVIGGLLFGFGVDLITKGALSRMLDKTFSRVDEILDEEEDVS